MTCKNPSPGNAPGLLKSRQGADTASVIAFLLAPMSDAELEDPELARIERRITKEAQRRAEEVWHIGYLRVVAAHEEYKLSMTRRLILDLEGSPKKEHAVQNAAKLAEEWRRQIVRQMLVPAVHKRHLAWKREQLKRLDVPFFAENIPKLRRFIDAEEIGLTHKRQTCA